MSYAKGRTNRGSENCTRPVTIMEARRRWKLTPADERVVRDAAAVVGQGDEADRIISAYAESWPDSARMMNAALDYHRNGWHR